LGCTANQIINYRTVLELLENVAWFRDAREAGKSRPTCTGAPAWYSYGESLSFRKNGPGVDTTAVQLFREIRIILIKLIFQFGVLISNQAFANYIGHAIAP
jgi:hypothetical protein